MITLSTFDKKRYKEKIKGFTQKQIAENMKKYDIAISEGGVKNWTRTGLNRLGKPYQPEFETLKALADMCKCSVQDFLTDANDQRQRITQQEIKNSAEIIENGL